MEHTQPSRSRSNTSKSSTQQPRPTSQGSTTSLQSVGVGGGFQPDAEQQMQGLPNGGYIHHGLPQRQQPYPHHPEQALLHQLQPQQQLDTSMHQRDLRPQSQHGYQEIHSYQMQYHPGPPSYPMQQSVMPQQHMHHMRHQSESYMEGSPAPEDSNNELGGAKRRKGTASSVANDQELKRLLQQYQNKTLKEVAAEVQRNEGSGGKSEKAKQVFAMLWLRDNCRRSQNSVRRDRVFSRYTERCGNERVPTLNPASFGKLVRIIFPNVQTRRLGVRGESKYHYVDLSLFPDDNEQYPTAYPPTTMLEDRQRQSSTEAANQVFNSHIRTSSISQSIPRPSMETADFPPPSAQFLSRSVDGPADSAQEPSEEQSPNMDCHYLNSPIIRIPTNGMPPSLVAALPSMRAKLPASLSSYLSMPQKNSQTLAPPSPQESPIDLPDIHVYLAGSNYDPSIADSLSHLYRSYCIDVIDSFRKCKEKPFFNHHSAFNGKMTVPVAKLFAMEKLAPWIQECDMRMYKQMIRVVAPLALQEVPIQVWTVFDHVSARLVGHLVTAFEEKCPTHVLVAKIVPAARFANMLKKLKTANSAAMHVATMLQDEIKRTQMWLDLLSLVDPEKVVDESLPPPEAFDIVEGILNSDLKTLANPLIDPAIEQAEGDPSSAFANFMLDHIGTVGILPSSSDSQPSGPLDRWVQWLEGLSQPFDKHHPQCMMNWHIRFWKSIMTQLGMNGAGSYQTWWYVEAFLTNMLDCMTLVEGMLMDEGTQRDLDDREAKKRKQQEDREAARRNKNASATNNAELKRKRDHEDVDGEERSHSQSQSRSGSENDTRENTQQPATDDDTKPSQPNEAQCPPKATSLALTPTLPQPAEADDGEEDDEMDQINQSGPFELPSISTGSSPLKRLLVEHLQSKHMQNDDSGIEIDLELDEGGLEELRKVRRELGLWSDPADGGDVVVV